MKTIFCGFSIFWRKFQIFCTVLLGHIKIKLYQAGIKIVAPIKAHFIAKKLIREHSDSWSRYLAAKEIENRADEHHVLAQKYMVKIRFVGAVTRFKITLICYVGGQNDENVDFSIEDALADIMSLRKEIVGIIDQFDAYGITVPDELKQILFQTEPSDFDSLGQVDELMQHIDELLEQID